MSSDNGWSQARGSRPEAALVTNHGYAGVEIPLGGAPDTGGQNFYVNQLAASLERLGHAVTIFARGGFPFFGEERIREGTEMLSDAVRYVYVPGGGDRFIRKEDISTALDEEVEWLHRFVEGEARQRGCRPWEVYEFVNTHYWDAAVMGVRLVEWWRDDLAAERLAFLLEGAADAAATERLVEDRHWHRVGLHPAYHLGQTLLAAEPPGLGPAERARRAAERWAEARGRPPGPLADRVHAAVEAACEGQSPALAPLRAGIALGETLLAEADPGGDLDRDLARLDTHAWTPHSIGELKDLNYRDKPLDVRRDLEFCERRSHERDVCARTRVFAATSSGIAEHLVTRLGVDPASLFYFPPCVDRTLFRDYSSEESAATWRYLAEKSGLAVERLQKSRIVFETSRQDRTKRKDLLLAAFAEAARDMEDALLFVGGGPENEIFEALREQRDADPVLKRQAFLLGFIPDDVMYPMFSLADVFVTPSEMEGFGMSASQAAAAGTALVSSDLVPFATLYVPDAAVVVPAGDAAGFAKAIRDLLGDAGDRDDRGRRLAEATRELDWDVQTGRFLEHLSRNEIPVTLTGRKS